MNTPTFTQARALEHYQALQREAEQAEIEAGFSAQNDDDEPKEPALIMWLLCVAFSITLTIGFACLAIFVIPWLRGFLS